MNTLSDLICAGEDDIQRLIGQRGISVGGGRKSESNESAD